MLRRNLALLTPYLLCLLLLGALSFRAPQLMTWVAIGDSITYLNDHPDQTGNRITKGYMTRVVEKLPYINFVNQGHNGWTAIRIAQQIDSLGLTKADIYSVFLGTNDWWHSKPLGRFSDYQQHTGTATVYGSFRVILDKLRRLNPQAHLLLITPMPRTDFVQINNPKNNAYGSYKPKEGQTLEAFAMAIDSIGHTEQIPVVDLYHLRGLRVEQLVKYKRLKDPATGHYVDYKYPAYTSIPFDPATDEYPYPPGAIARTYDGLHPSDKGYELITRALVKQIKAFRQAN